MVSSRFPVSLRLGSLGFFGFPALFFLFLFPLPGLKGDSFLIPTCNRPHERCRDFRLVARRSLDDGSLPKQMLVYSVNLLFVRYTLLVADMWNYIPKGITTIKCAYVKVDHQFSNGKCEFFTEVD